METNVDTLNGEKDISRTTLEWVAVDDRERVWLANRGGSLIEIYRLKHGHISYAGQSPAHTYSALDPHGNLVPYKHPPVLLAFDPADNFWRTSPSTGRIEISFADANYKTNEEFYNLHSSPSDVQGVAVDAKGNLWYTEHDNGLLSQKLYRFSHDRYVGSEAYNAYRLDDHGKRFHPRRIAIDNRGNVWIAGDEGVMRVNPPGVAPVRTPLLGQPKAP